MKYGSVCSGIEAASQAWEPLGWKPAWFSEIEPFPSAVLAYHWPDVKNLGDMTQIASAVQRGEVEAPDILVGGTPCQAFSVAGLRAGLDDGHRYKAIGNSMAVPVMRWIGMRLNLISQSSKYCVFDVDSTEPE